MRLSMRTPTADCLRVGQVYLDGVDVTARGVLMLDTDTGEVEVYKLAADGSRVVSGNNRYYETEVLHGKVTYTYKPTSDVDRLMQPNWEQHVEVIPSASSTCPVCGVDTPHTHAVPDAAGYEGEDGG